MKEQIPYYIPLTVTANSKVTHFYDCPRPLYCLGCGKHVEGHSWIECESRYSVVKCWRPEGVALTWFEKEE